MFLSFLVDWYALSDFAHKESKTPKIQWYFMKFHVKGFHIFA